MTKLTCGFQLAVLFIGMSSMAFGTTVFADNFDDGDVSDWTKFSNFAGTTNITVRGDAFVSPGYSLYTYLSAPPTGSALTVQASHGFTAPSAGDYTLTLWAMSSPCSGCTISYDVIIDGIRLDRKQQTSAFEYRTIYLTNLASGAHTLTLGMFTTLAINGVFSASFDDVSIVTGTPEPSSAILLLSGLGVLGAAIRRRV